MTLATGSPTGVRTTSLTARQASSMSLDDVRTVLSTPPGGLSSASAASRLDAFGPNALKTHHAQLGRVFARQVHNPLLVLLLVSAVVSFFVGERADAVIIGAISTLSIGLGFVNEYRAERASEMLHSQLRHLATVRRDGWWTSCDVTELVPGDLVRLRIGSVVPADLRLASTIELECNEAALTGESLPRAKDADAIVVSGAALGDLVTCAFMGTVVTNGVADAVVVATGATTEFGRIAVDLGERPEQTAFQVGLRRFSVLLARVAGVLTVMILVTNLLLRRPLIDAVLFSLAIAVGVTPQLLPAVVTTSLATGARRLARRRVLVKRMVCIEDLGNIEVLLTDKTGTLTEGRVRFRAALDATGTPSDLPLRYGLLCNDADAPGAAGSTALDEALWEAPAASSQPLDRYRRVAVLPFDHARRRVSTLVDGPDGRVLIVKGAPEQVLARCDDVPPAAMAWLDREFAAGSRVVAVAARPARAELASVTADDERDLALAGFLTFTDEPKASAAIALDRLRSLDVRVHVVTGDNAVVAEHVCDALGLTEGETITGVELDALDDEAVLARLPSIRIFARMDPEQKVRIVRLYRRRGVDVAYLGDGVNDAVALHTADVGISVDSATDVARDAADIVLLEKDLDVLADGVVEGRRVFANTIKYVLMSTSSNFGNMFSAAAASAFLAFLPMLPSQILLNNLLYDAGQLTIPTDRVDEEQLARPAHWDVGFIRRFMVFFGPISSLFDFLTFAVMLHVFEAGPALFRSGWFVESLATQSLVIFVVRTRRVPSWRSRAGVALTATTLLVVVTAMVLPMSPLADRLGFARLPIGFFGVLIAMIAAYLALAEAGKVVFYAAGEVRHRAPPSRQRRLQRRAARFSHGGPLD